MVLIDLIYNLALLVALSVVGGFVERRWKRTTRLGALFQGVVFGGAAVIGMLRPFVFAPGLIFDGRSVMISLSALFFGPWAAAVACLMTIPLRIVQGGPGTMMGILGILTSAAIGIGFYLRWQQKPRELSVFELMGFGVVVHLAMLAMTVALPRDMLLPVLKRIGLPVMVSYPLATVMIGKILSDQTALGGFQELFQKLKRSFRVVSECDKAMIRATDEVALLNRICHIVTDIGGYRMAWVGYAEEDEARSVRPVAQAGFEDDYLEALQSTWSDTERGLDPTGTAIRTSKPCVARCILTDPHFAPRRAEALKRGYASSLVLPLKRDGRAFGALNIFSAQSDAFDVEEANLLAALADDLAYGITALRDRAERKLAETLLGGQKQVLEMIVAGAALPEELAKLVSFIESQAPGMLGSILLLDEDGVHVRHGAGPSLPAEFLAAVDGQPIGPCAGSCGTAAYRKEAVFVEDIATDPLWAVYKAAALPHGLRACWSTPIFDARRQVLGTFAMYYRQPGLPQPEHQRLIDIATHIAAIAISHHRAEAALRSKTEELDGYFTNSLDLLCIADTDSYFRRLNPEWERTLGYPVAELEGRRFLDFVHPKDVAATLAVVDKLSSREHVVNFVNRYRHKDGSYRWFEWRAYAADRRIYAVARDITERKQTEKALCESERKYRELVENANSIILHWTRDGRIIFLNEFGQQFFGYTEAEIRGRPVIGTLVPETESSGRDLHSLMEEICANPTAFNQNINENIRRNGERVWIAWTNKIVLDQQGQVSEILSIGSDISERKRAEEQVIRLHEELQRHAAELEQRVIKRTAQLAAARDRAESADRVKSAFLATMSHELRTPLNSIIGFTGLLLQGLAGPLNAEQTKQLGMVKGSGQHLLALINDVLDISKIEAGQIEIVKAPFDLRESIQKVVQTVTPLADKKQLPLIIQIAPDMGPITSDRRRIEQILLNLLSNAIKFTERGEITLTAEFQPAATTEGASLVPGARRVLRMAVRDTGSGIKFEDVEKLFQPFRQLDSGLARQHEGTGLGLAICKRLVERLDGTITVESEFGKGSTFQITLPIYSDRTL